MTGRSIPSVPNFLSKVSDTLEFVPNAFADTLDILDLKTPEKGFDPLPLIIIGACLIVIGAATVTVIVIKKNLKKKTALIKRK